MATYDWINGQPVRTDNTNKDWVNGLPYIIVDAVPTSPSASISSSPSSSISSSPSASESASISSSPSSSISSSPSSSISSSPSTSISSSPSSSISSSPSTSISSSISASISSSPSSSVSSSPSASISSSPSSSPSTSISGSPSASPSPEWSGLGMFVLSVKDNITELSATFDDDLDVLVANGFTDIKLDNCTDNATVLSISKQAVAIALAKGLNVLWGRCWWNGATLTAAAWDAHAAGVLDAAQWAQDNGVTYFQIGNEDEASIDGTTLTLAQFIINMKALATDVQAIFTNGPITYSAYYTAIDEWITAGRGDIDIICQNIYRGNTVSTEWQDFIDNAVTAFGVDHTWITEFGLNATSINTYSTDEAVQAAGIAEMVDYIQASGITKAFYFLYYDDYRPYGPTGFGALKTDLTYRLLWYELIGGPPSSSISASISSSPSSSISASPSASISSSISASISSSPSSSISASPSSSISASISSSPSSSVSSSPSDSGSSSVSSSPSVSPSGDQYIWEGLGMGWFTPYNETTIDTELNVLLAAGFDTLRMDIPDWDDATWISWSKIGVLAAVAKGFNVIWGLASFATDITTSNIGAYNTAVGAAALWAQNNGVYEFQIGNELEYHIDDTTIVEADVLGLMRSLATSCQAIFTNGNISYSAGYGTVKYTYPGETRGDIDLIGMNVYRQTTSSTLWSECVDALVSLFGTDHSHISEFNIHNTAIATYSADTDIQASATREMIDYFKAVGLPSALYFWWKNDALGVRNANGTYKEKIWYVLRTAASPSASPSSSASSSPSASPSASISSSPSASVSSSPSSSISASISASPSSSISSSPSASISASPSSSISSSPSSSISSSPSASVSSSPSTSVSVSVSASPSASISSSPSSSISSSPSASVSSSISSSISSSPSASVSSSPSSSISSSPSASASASISSSISSSPSSSPSASASASVSSSPSSSVSSSPSASVSASVSGSPSTSLSSSPSSSPSTSASSSPSASASSSPSWSADEVSISIWIADTTDTEIWVAV